MSVDLIEFSEQPRVLAIIILLFVEWLRTKRLPSSFAPPIVFLASWSLWLIMNVGDEGMGWGTLWRAIGHGTPTALYAIVYYDVAFKHAKKLAPRIKASLGSRIMAARRYIRKGRGS